MTLVGDLYTSMLPMIAIYRMEVLRMKKWPLYLLFGAAFCVVMASVARLVYLLIVLYGTYDLSWYLWNAIVWTTFEVHWAIIVISLPAIKPLLERVMALGQKSSNEFIVSFPAAKDDSDRSEKTGGTGTPRSYEVDQNAP